MRKQVSDRLKKAIRQGDTSISDIAEKSEYTPKEIAGLVRGEIETEQIRRIAPAVGVDSRWLRDGHEDPEAEVPEWDEVGQEARARRFVCSRNKPCG